MSGRFSKGEAVSWRWGANTAHGKIAETFTRRVKRTIKGNVVIRNGTSDDPAYLIVQEDGGRVLKSQSELSGD